MGAPLAVLVGAWKGDSICAAWHNKL